jgi:hypothetical protein
VAHYGKHFEESNRSFHEAERLIDQLYTISISKEAASYVLNDNTTAYGGEDFESALVNLFMAVNYAAQGYWEDALVEARRVDTKLTIFNDQYPEGEKNVYKEDAFIRFLMGVLYEAQGEYNDAYISYAKAEKIYSEDYQANYGLAPPRFVIEKLFCSARANVFSDRAEAIIARYPHIDPAVCGSRQDLAEVYALHYNGAGAVKVEDAFPVPMPDAYILKIAYPRFERQERWIQGSVVTLKGIESGKTHVFASQTMEDISAIAEGNLADRILRVKVKAIARATAKYLAAKAAEEEIRRQNDSGAASIFKLIAQTAMIVTEQADLRHWRTLPAEIRVGRMMLPQGTYEGHIEFVDSGGKPLQFKAIPRFFVGPGQKRFFVFRTID